MKVRSLREVVPVGEEAEVLVTAYRADYRPAERQAVEVTVPAAAARATTAARVKWCCGAPTS